MVQLGSDSDEEGFQYDLSTQKFTIRKPITPYVTSTPIDFKTERKFLADKVFPKLDELCKKRGTSFFPVDLQWRPNSFMTETGHLVKNNLDYIQKCSPFFLCLLGETYGPHRDPEGPKLPQSVRDLPENPPWLDENYLVAASAGYSWLTQEDQQNCSVPEIEIVQAAFLSDSRYSFFYFRQPEHLDHRFPNVSEEEMLELSKPYKPASEYADLNIRNLKQRIVNKGLPVKYFQTCEELGRKVEGDWLDVINSLYPPLLSSVHIDTEEYREWMNHEAFAESRREKYISFSELRAIEEELSDFSASVLDETFLEPEEPRSKYRAYSITSLLRKPPSVKVKQKSLMVLTGDRGSGKSTLVANWVKRFSSENPEVKVISHYVGSSGRSRDIMVFLRRATAELREEFLKQDAGNSQSVTGEADRSQTYKELCQSFHAAISLAPCVLLIDGVDELGASLNQTPQEVKSFSWLPMPLPSQCRVVMTTSSSDYCHTSLQNRPDTQFLRLPLITKSKYKLEHLEEQMGMHFEHLNSNYLTEIYESKMSGRPLFISILSNEMKAFSVYMNLEPYVEQIRDVCSSIRDLYLRSFKRWVKDHNWTYEVLSAEHTDKKVADFIGWVPDVLRLLAVSRSGLTEKEVLKILVSIGYRENVKVTYFDWLMFRMCIGNNLLEKPNGLLDFSHQHLREVSEYILLRTVKASTAEILSNGESDKIWKRQKKTFHNHLVQYFSSQGRNQRRIEELPYQYLMAGDMEGLKRIVTDPEFFLELMDIDEKNPSNRHDLKMYWHYLQSEGVCPVQSYQELLVNMSVLLPDFSSGEADEYSQHEDEPMIESSPEPDHVFTPPSPQQPKTIPKIVTTMASDEMLPVIEESVSLSDSDLQIQLNGEEKSVSDNTNGHTLNGHGHGDNIFVTQGPTSQDSSKGSPYVSNTNTVRLMWYIAVFLRDLKKTEGAEKILLTLCDRLIRSFPLGEEDQLTLVKVQQSLGEIYLQSGNIPGAEEWYKKALRTVMDMYDLEENSDISQELQALKGKVIGEIGLLRLRDGLLDDADDLLEEALHISNLTGRLPLRTRILYHIGILRLCQCDYLMAETSLRNALILQERWYGKSHPVVADTLLSLAQLMSNNNNDKGYDKMAAEDAYRRTLIIREHYLGKEHLDVSYVLFELGKLLRGESSNAGKTECVRLLQRALDIRITQLGGDHIDTRAVRQFLNGLEVNLKAAKHDVRTSERPYSSLSWRGTELANMERKSSRLLSGKSSMYGVSSRPSSQISRPGSQFSRTGSLMSRPVSGRMDLMSSRSSLHHLPASEKLIMDMERPRLLQRQSIDQRRLKMQSGSETSLGRFEPQAQNATGSGYLRKQIMVELHTGDASEPPEVREADPLLDSFMAESEVMEKTGVKFSKASPKSMSPRNHFENGTGRESPPERLFRRFGSPKNGSNSAIVVRKEVGSGVRPKRPVGSARSVASSFYTTASGFSEISSKSHKSKCDIPAGPHSIHISNARTTTIGPHSSLKSLVGSTGPKDISRTIHHKSAYYHVPGRYATSQKKYPPKRSQKRPEAKSMEGVTAPTAQDPYQAFMKSDYRKNRTRQEALSPAGVHTCGKGQVGFQNYHKHDRKNYVLCESCQREAEANVIVEMTGEGEEDENGVYLAPTVSGLTPRGQLEGYTFEEPMTQEDFSYTHSGPMVKFKDTVSVN